MRLTSLLALPAALLAGSFFACGGHVEVDGTGQPGPSPTGTGTTSPTGSPTGTGTSTPPGTPTGSPTGTGTTEPVPPPPPPSGECSHTSDRLNIALAGAITGSCSSIKPGGGPSTGPIVATGQIVRVGKDFIDLNTCPPTADCIAAITTVNVSGAGLDLSTLPVKSLVKVTATFRWSWGCTSTILVQSIADWYGIKNTIDGGGVTYLVGGEGETSVEGAPFSVGRIATGCMKPSPYPPCSSTKVDDFELAFTGIGSGSTTSIPMGRSARFLANGQVLEARNLRAYYNGACDAYWDYAFWAKASYGTK